MVIKGRRFWFAVAFSILMVASLSQFSCRALGKGEMGTSMRPAVVANGKQFSVVTTNTWRLNEEHRIQPLLGALARLGTDLGRTGSTMEERLPDVILFQELEARKAIHTLARSLKPEHHLEVGLCDDWKSGRSAVGVAFRQSRFTLVNKRKIDLKRFTGDHRRCAMAVKVRPKGRNEILTFVTVHMSIWESNSALQSAILRQELAKDPHAKRVLLAGDFNFSTNSKGYQIIRTFLQDPYPNGRGRTHWFRGRIDFAFVSRKIRLLRPLSRLLAFENFRPKRVYLFVPSHCKKKETWKPTCPISDHLPEGGLFQFE